MRCPSAAGHRRSGAMFGARAGALDRGLGCGRRHPQHRLPRAFLYALQSGQAASVLAPVAAPGTSESCTTWIQRRHNGAPRSGRLPRLSPHNRDDSRVDRYSIVIIDNHVGASALSDSMTSVIDKSIVEVFVAAVETFELMVVAEGIDSPGQQRTRWPSRRARCAERASLGPVAGSSSAATNCGRTMAGRESSSDPIIPSAFSITAVTMNADSDTPSILGQQGAPYVLRASRTWATPGLADAAGWANAVGVVAPTRTRRARRRAAHHPARHRGYLARAKPADIANARRRVQQCRGSPAVGSGRAGATDGAERCEGDGRSYGAGPAGAGWVDADDHDGGQARKVRWAGRGEDGVDVHRPSGGGGD